MPDSCADDRDVLTWECRVQTDLITTVRVQLVQSEPSVPSFQGRCSIIQDSESRASCMSFLRSQWPRRKGAKSAVGSMDHHHRV